MDYSIIINKVMKNMLNYISVCYNTAECTKYIVDKNIQGDLVECGVFAGAQVAIMAYVLQEMKQNRKIHLFDSFRGIPEAGPNDDQQPGIEGIKRNGQGRLISSGVAVCSLLAVKTNMNMWGIDENILEYHKGWFQETILTWNKKPIALLRLDGDLYESTKICLEGLFSNLVQDGIIIVDDYDLTGCKKATDEYLKSIDKNIKFTVIERSSGAVWGINN